jgi:hypothetical protein
MWIYDLQDVRLFSPSKFKAGSSLYHVDTESYDIGSELMIPGLPYQLAIHYPGLRTLRIMQAIGWELRPGATNGSWDALTTNYNPSAAHTLAGVDSLVLLISSVSLYACLSYADFRL